jgi:hypothetical protein
LSGKDIVGSLSFTVRLVHTFKSSQCVFARKGSRPILTEQLHRVLGGFPFYVDDDGWQRHGVAVDSGAITSGNSPFQGNMSICCSEEQDGARRSKSEQVKI